MRSDGVLDHVGQNGARGVGIGGLGDLTREGGKLFCFQGLASALVILRRAAPKDLPLCAKTDPIDGEPTLW